MKTVHSALFILTALAIGLLAHAASALTITWNVGTGSWHDANNWNPAIEPVHYLDHDVIHNNGGNLNLFAGRGVYTYNQTGGSFTMNNNGVQLNGGGSLAGGGLINLNAGGFIQGSQNVLFTVTNGTIRGYGEIGYNGLSLLNGPAGIIQADVLGQTFDLDSSGTFTNNGLMRALNGGRFRFNGSADVMNNSTIRAESGAQVEIYTRIIGGTLDNAGSNGRLLLGGGVLRDVTIGAGSTVTNVNNNSRLEDRLVNLGTLSLADGNSIRIGTNTSLTGGGTIALTPGTIYDYAAGQILTNTNNTIRGYGGIGYPGALSLVNAAAGIVQADVAAQPLSLDGSGTFTNNGLMRATNGGRLQFNGSADVMNNNTIRAENGSQVEIYTRIVGGTLDNASSSGTIILSGGVLRNVTIGDGSTVMSQNGRLENSLVNLGTLSVPTSLRIGPNTSLSGGGTIDLMNGGTLQLDSWMDLNGGTLRGNGTIQGEVRNNGGIFSPGHSPGKITINGNYIQGANGTLNMEIGGTTAGTEYDQLVVTGNAGLGGTLNLTLINGFRPQVGDVFQLIVPNTTSGSFATINTIGFTGTVNYANGGITLTVNTVPDIPLNISTRMHVGTDPNQLIGGFIVTGSEPKEVIILATGPSLEALGLQGVLADPVLELFQGNTLIASNDNWKIPAQAEIEATGVKPTHDLESALVRTLAPGAYTAVVRGTNGTGVATVQLYDLSQTSKSKLANISSRGFVQTADDRVMIAGFIIGGNGGANSGIIVRAIAPSLSGFIAGVLPDPTLELKDANGSTLVFNDDWQQSPQAADISARGLNPSDTHESALGISLPNGGYTAIVRGKAGATGVAVVEVYNVE